VFLARKLLCILSVFLCTPLVCAQSKPGTLNLTLTTIDVPGAMNTSVLGINSAGDMVGYWYNGTGATSTGFLLSGGNFTFFNYPGGDATLGFGINDSGLISGTALIAQDTGSVGFLYDGTTFTTISVRGMQNTLVYGLNNVADIVGADGGASANQAFERIGSRFRNVTPPPGGYISAGATGINNFGEVVGYAGSNGFAFKQGTFQTVAFPGASTSARGVNDNGIIVGNYEICAPCAFHGFALMHGKYISLDYPGATATYADGLNNAGQIVGTYSLDGGLTFHGFVSSPVIDTDIP
jgi:hypothetical protein